MTKARPGRPPRATSLICWMERPTDLDLVVLESKFGTRKIISLHHAPESQFCLKALEMTEKMCSSLPVNTHAQGLSS